MVISILYPSSLADPGRQIWHRVFFDTIAKRIYRDGLVYQLIEKCTVSYIDFLSCLLLSTSFEIEREFFDVVNSKTYYHLSH